MQAKEQAVKEVADGSITFEHVDFSYAGEGGPLSLKDVNLSIKPGQTVGIIGGTGSSKSGVCCPISGIIKSSSRNFSDRDTEMLAPELIKIQTNTRKKRSLYVSVTYFKRRFAV